jgi:hypothetical protein
MVVKQPSSDAYTLRRVSWHFFITLTLDSDEENPNAKFPPDYVLRRCVFEFLRRLAKHYKVDYQWGMQWVVRHELGEQKGRPHFHLLIRLPEYSSNPTSTIFYLKDLWSNKVGKNRKVCGFADVRPYDRGRGAADYIVKDTSWNLDQANEYELAKFTQGQYAEDQRTYLITSPSVVWELYKAQTRIYRRQSRNGGGHYARFLKGLKQGSVRSRGKESRWSPERFRHPADEVGRTYC